MSLYQTFMQILSRAGGVSVSDLYPPQHKKPLDERLVIEEPWRWQAALLAGADVHGAALVLGYELPKEAKETSKPYK